MKTYLFRTIQFVSITLLWSSLGGCKREVDIDLLVGNPGNPRFNLQFTNEVNVDLDLYVKDPNGEIIYYGNKRARKSPGQLDVDCLCSSCPQGPNENIFWPLTGQSPQGKYEFWVNYYRACGSIQPSSYTVRVTNDVRPATSRVFVSSGTLTGNGAAGLNSIHWIYDTATNKVTEK